MPSLSEPDGRHGGGGLQMPCVTFAPNDGLLTSCGRRFLRSPQTACRSTFVNRRVGSAAKKLPSARLAVTRGWSGLVPEFNATIGGATSSRGACCPVGRSHSDRSCCDLAWLRALLVPPLPPWRQDKSDQARKRIQSIQLLISKEYHATDVGFDAVAT